MDGFSQVDPGHVQIPFWDAALDKGLQFLHSMIEFLSGEALQVFSTLMIIASTRQANYASKQQKYSKLHAYTVLSPRSRNMLDA